MSEWNEAIEAAKKLLRSITGEGLVKAAPGCCARGWKITGDDCPKCGATDNQNCPGDLFDAEKIAACLDALRRPEPQGVTAGSDAVKCAEEIVKGLNLQDHEGWYIAAIIARHFRATPADPAVKQAWESGRDAAAVEKANG